jgi:polyhydroxybutyrate depolymerase
MTPKKSHYSAIAGIFALLASFLVLLGAPAHADSGTPTITTPPNGADGLDYGYSFTFGGLTRTYRVFVPNHVAADPGALVFLRSDGPMAPEVETNLDLDAGQKGYYVVWPDSMNGVWDARVCCAPSLTDNIDDVGFIDQVMLRFKLQYAVDPGKIAVGGESGGALMSFYYACHTQQTWQTLMPETGSALSADCASLPQHYNVMAINGGKDATLPWENQDPDLSTREQMDKFSKLDGCDGTWTVTHLAGQVDQRVAGGCPANASVLQYLPLQMPHVWTTSLQYGINVTATYATYLNQLWSLTPAQPLTAPGPLPEGDVEPVPPILPPILPTPLPPLGSPTWGAATVAPHGALGSTYNVTFPYGTGIRQFRLFVPTKRATKPGLMVMLPDFGVTAAGAEIQSDLDTIAGQSGHYVLYPEATLNPAWNAGICCGFAVFNGADDVAFIDLAINTVASRFAFTPNRIAVGGMANGAMMAIKYACEGQHAAQEVFGVAQLASSNTCTSLRPMHVLAINGLKDGLTRWSSVNSLVVYTGIQPSSKDAMDAYAPALHCTTAWKTTVDPKSHITKRVAPCAPGNSLEQDLVGALGHLWTSTPADWSTNGINATVVTWDFVKQYWT